MKKRTSVLLIALATLTAFVLFATALTKAAYSDTVTGNAWSSNIGWISFNNCNSGGSCSGPDYGLTLNESSGLITGTAWSSNIGWVTFDNVGCPYGSCGAYANIAAGSGDSFPIQGWARACSVYASGCSGGLASSAYSGGWDGWISLSGSGYGLTLGPAYGGTRAITGSVWGSEVIGWTAVDAQTRVSDFTYSDISVSSCTTQGTSPNFYWNSPSTASCTISMNGSSVNVPYSSQAAGGSQLSDGKYYKTAGPTLPWVNSTASWNYQLYCSNGMASIGRSVDVAPCPVDICTTLPGMQTSLPAGFTFDSSGIGPYGQGACVKTDPIAPPADAPFNPSAPGAKRVEITHWGSGGTCTIAWSGGSRVVTLQDQGDGSWKAISDIVFPTTNPQVTVQCNGEPPVNTVTVVQKKPIFVEF